MQKILIITTVADLSVPLFLTQAIADKIRPDFFFFHESTGALKEKLTANQYQYIYIRDPFNYSFNEPDIKEKIEVILNNRGDTYLVDNIESLDDVYFEDKWHQYQLFSEFMPKTEILENTKDADRENIIVKKRISSRARGIVFGSGKLAGRNPADYIIQEKINIEKEYRIYVIFNDILENASIKNSKTRSSKVSISGVEKISDAVKEFTQMIIKLNKFDFIGLDIAQAGEKLYLLEINRSCLFNGYFKSTKVNLAEIFVDKLTEKSN